MPSNRRPSVFAPSPEANTNTPNPPRAATAAGIRKPARQPCACTTRPAPSGPSAAPSPDNPRKSPMTRACSAWLNALAISASASGAMAVTAWNALFETAQLQSGQRVLIHGGAGGVGHFAVQLAKRKGAHVIATASAKNHELVYELGADEVIDYQAQKFEDVARKIDIVLDSIGGDTQERSWKVLKKGGVLVSIVQPPSGKKARSVGARGAMVQTGRMAPSLPRSRKSLTQANSRR